MFIKKNIWSLFYIITFIGLVFLTLFLTLIYNNIKNENIIQQENITNMTARSVSHVLTQYDIVLSIIGKELLHKNHNNRKDIQDVLNELINTDPTIISFVLINENGQVYHADSKFNKTNQKYPNLLDDKRTRNSFIETLNSNNLVVGRTYFQKNLDRYIIPIRKTIKDKEGRVITVVSAAIDLNKGFGFFINDSSLNLYQETILFRENDKFLQIASKKHQDNPKIYDYKIDEKIIKIEEEKTQKKYQLSMKEIRDKQIIVTTVSSDKIPTLRSSVFIKKHNLWVSTQIQLSVIQNQFIKEALIVISTFLIVIVIIYTLFKTISKSENKKREELVYQSTHDYLTNLHNRFYLSTKFKNLNPNKPFSLFYIDMDNFKNINDSYGHEYGDKILIDISQRLKNLKNENESIIRYSGDEFLFLTDTLKVDKIEILAKKIIKTLSAPYIVRGQQFIIGTSIGISRYPFDANNINELKKYADISMYESKHLKNTYTIFNEEIKDQYHTNALIEKELKAALQKDELYMVYQPQIDNSKNLYGIEALVRWENEKLGFVPPNKFISIAESLGIMHTIGDFVIEKTLNEIYEIQKNSKKEFYISINISVKQFLKQGFFENFINMVEKSKVKRELITLEVTENVFIEDVNYIIELLKKLKEENIKLSLDDFGTGYSSLNLLKKLPIDEIKIDKSFIDDILKETDSKSMVKTIVNISKKMNLKIVAEGVENEEQKDLLLKYGCDIIQGYFYSKPLKKEQLKTYLEK